MRLALRRSSEEEGVSLIELLVATAIFVMVMTAAVASLGSAFNMTRNDRARSVAANLASQEMDAVRTTTFDQLSPGLVTTTQDVDLMTYTIKRNVQWINASSSTGACDAQNNSAVPSLLRVTVTITWPNMGVADPVTSQTVIAPPIGAYDPTTGHIAVKVFDRDALASEGVVVTVTGPENTAQTTGADGCAFFAYLTPGSYTVTLNSVGYVDEQGVATPSQPVTVMASSISSLQFDYDRASTLVLTLNGPSSGVAPANVAVTLGNTQLLPVGIKSFQGSGSPRTITNLFPYANGYQLWGGDCSDADPEGLQSDGTPYYPGRIRENQVALTPGATTAAVLRMETVKVKVRTSGGVDKAGVTVQAVHAPDNGCTAGNTLTLGVTDSGGKINAAMPFGLWEFRAVGLAPESGTWPSAWVVPPVSATGVDLDVVVAP